MSDTSPRVLVTGGAGYIGSHTCKALARAGFVPVTFDSLVTGNDWSVRWGPFERGDLGEVARVREVLRAHRPVGVIHFAALSLVGESVEQPARYYANNVGGTIALVQAMAAEGVGRLVFSSTCATYGTPRRVPISEDEPQAPINPYGHSKLMVERVLRDVAARGGLSAVSLRYFNAAGGDPEGEIGEEHDPETHLIPVMLGAVAGKRPPLTVFGNDHPTPDGTCIRDYIHVTDLADAHLKALDRTAAGPGFEAYNLGTGTGVSVREMIAAAEAVTGRAVPYEIGPRREGDPPVLVADPSRARRELGWAPGISDIETILRTAWAWMVREG